MLAVTGASFAFGAVFTGGESVLGEASVLVVVALDKVLGLTPLPVAPVGLAVVVVGADAGAFNFGAATPVGGCAVAIKGVNHNLRYACNTCFCDCWRARPWSRRITVNLDRSWRWCWCWCFLNFNAFSMRSSFPMALTFITVTWLSLTNIPWFGGHVKYRTPCTDPSFFPPKEQGY